MESTGTDNPGTVAAPAISNADWIAGLRAGRAETLAALRARIREGLSAALAGRGDVSDADLDDFTQDAMLRVLERLDSFRGDSRFTTWAMAVAVRVSLTALRRRKWSAAPIGAHLDELAEIQETDTEAAAAGARAELLGALRGAITNDLTPRQRQVLLGELEGIPQVVLADRLGSTPGAIYKTSHDARKKLRAALARAGFDLETAQDVLANGN